MLSEVMLKVYVIRKSYLKMQFQVPNLKSLGNIQRSKLWLDDTPQTYIYPHLELQSDQIQAIIADGGQVLVHCVAGVSRSASICLAYLTKYKCRSLRDAYHLMASKRPMVRPNLGFWRQLIAFEQEVKKSCGSVRLVRDEAQQDKLLPDVYLPMVIQERPQVNAFPHIRQGSIKIDFVTFSGGR
uniref:Protein-tyrosine-phosphatase n=1 Tax=Parascaris univalens TaxID=6257 RepID=A0A915ACP4_PARUN